MISSAILSLFLAGSALAQSESASVSVSAVESAVAGPSFSESSAMSAMPSAAATASASGIPVATNTSYGFDCPAGYLLTYGITNATYTGVDLQTAVAYFQNWSGAAPGMVSESTETTRTYMPAGEGLEGVTISEVLTNSTVDPTTGALHQTFNSTAPITLTAQAINIASTFSDFQIYANETTGATTVQYFTNVCSDNQDATLAALPIILSGATTYWASQLTGAVQSGAGSGSMSMMASSTAGGVLGSASSALASATGAPASILSSATGAPAGILSSVTAGPAGVLSSITGAIPTPSLRARGRWD